MHNPWTGDGDNSDIKLWEQIEHFFLTSGRKVLAQA